MEEKIEEQEVELAEAKAENVILEEMLKKLSYKHGLLSGKVEVIKELTSQIKIDVPKPKDYPMPDIEEMKKFFNEQLKKKNGTEPAPTTETK